MHPLLAEPTTEQRHLLEVIYEGRGLASSEVELRWPIFQYVERELYRRYEIDAMHALAECPIVGGPRSGGQYGWTWSQTRQPGDAIGLTVAGMAQIPAAEHEVSLFVAVLRLLVEEDRSSQPSPTEVQTISVTSQELEVRLPPTWYDKASLAGVPSILDHEPATWHCIARPSDDGWDLELGPLLRRYARLQTAQEYLERLIEVMTPVVPEPSPLYPSPLSLPEAIDYLNAVWRLHAGKALIRIGRAEAAAKLVLGCANADEFESRLSAVCSILDVVDVPDRSDSKLVDLREYLQVELTEESATRALEAVDDLRALFDLRVWRQHVGTENRATRGMTRLGVSLPVYDWGDAWQQIQTRTVAAISALREEIETLVPTR